MSQVVTSWGCDLINVLILQAQQLTSGHLSVPPPTHADMCYTVKGRDKRHANSLKQ